jgi:hypothetical protein
MEHLPLVLVWNHAEKNPETSASPAKIVGEFASHMALAVHVELMDREVWSGRSLYVVLGPSTHPRPSDSICNIGRSRPSSGDWWASRPGSHGWCRSLLYQWANLGGDWEQESKQFAAEELERRGWR